MKLEELKNNKSSVVFIAVFILLLLLFDDVRLRLKIGPIQQSYSALQKRYQDETISLLAQNKLLVEQISSLLSEKAKQSSPNTQSNKQKAKKAPGTKK